MLDDLAGEMRGQRPTGRLASLSLRLLRQIVWRLAGAQALIEIGERELELLDLGLELLRRTSKGHAQETRHPRFERLDLQTLREQSCTGLVQLGPDRPHGRPPARE